jgi:hypothetical protein
MAMLELEIIQQLDRYAHRQMSFDQFVEWFVPISLSVANSGDNDAIQLANRIDGILGEASSAHWSEEDIHEELARPFVGSSIAEEVFGDPSSLSIPASSVPNVCVPA